MAKIFINLNQNTGPLMAGWTASIGKAYTPKGGKAAIAMGESQIYNTKNQAWATIENRASQLDYVNEEVHFNHARVESYVIVQVLVAAL